MTEFWSRMGDQFGATYSDYVARDQSLPDLGGRTALQALAEGVDVRSVWLAVCEQFEVPKSKRH